MRTLMIMILCLVLTAGTALAGKTPVVTRVGDYEVQEMNFGAPTRSDCVIGCTMPPAFAITDWIWGDEGYKLLVCPYMCCTVCPLGWWIEDVNWYMQFGPEDVPAVFDVYVDLEDALWDPATQCWYPGIEDCISQVYTVTIDAAGLYEISIPLYDECDCAYFFDPITLDPYYYFLSFHIVTFFDPTMRPDAITQDSPVACTSYNDYGFGWEDLVVDYGWPGNIIIWANALCCDFPIAAAPATWGNVKSLYR